MKILLTIIVALMAIGFASCNGMAPSPTPNNPGYVPTGSYSDSEDSYSTLGVHGTKLGTGGNSACPNEPILIRLGLISGWSLCCENEIKFFPQVNTVPPKCCGPNPYDPIGVFCCGGVLNPITTTSACCKGVVYDRLKFVCCNNQIIRLSANQANTGIFECCGSMATYGSSAYGYSQYSAQNYTTGAQYNYYPAASYGLYAQQQYQGSYQFKLINIINEICCSGNVINITGLSLLEKSKTSCCGNKIYNSQTQACCGSVVVNRTVNSTFQSCCGNDLFDPSTDLCCNNHKKPLIVDGKEQKCCATNSYDPMTQVCCAGYVVNITGGEYNYNVKCCGINVYYPSSHICCSGVPVSLIPNVLIVNQRCCGFEVYDRTQYSCCNQENILPKGKKCAYY